jgi:2-hydroxy-3-keto-5-methylthiopentenyl-1-phosphate phosphatase
VENNGRISVLCDFDGTVAERDVGHCLFETFVKDRSRWLDTLEQWEIGLISSRECLENEISWLDAGMDDIERFVGGERLDPYFKDFVDFCVRKKYDIQILSDGLDYYIDMLLMREGVGFVPFKANHLVHDDGRVNGIDFPHFDTMECSMCGNCKLHHLEEKQRAGYFTVYVGNGHSDRCPAEHAGFVLAKGELLDHCRREGISCVPFENFRDVEREMTNRFVIPG